MCDPLEVHMGLTRNLRSVGNRLTAATPAQVADMLDMAAGDQLEFDYFGNGTLRLRKVGT